MKKILIGFILLIVVILSIGIYKFDFKNQKQTSIYDGTYKINGKEYTLKNGISEVTETSGSASKIITKAFGNRVSGDFDNNGTEDLGFLLTQETGGSGTFFYFVALLKFSDGDVGTEAVYIGDRIAPQTTEFRENGVIIVNYGDRNPGESMTTRVSLGKSLYLKLNPQTLQFGEVVQNFEGEADPSKMNVYMKTWNWISTTYNDGKKITPKQEGKFTLTFMKDGSFSITTDCNNAGGNYSEKDKKISFGSIFITEMYCEGSQEKDFIKGLEQVESYYFTSKGELIFNIKFDSGSIIFR